MDENTLTEAQYDALIEAFRTVAPKALGITAAEAQLWIAEHAQQAAEMLDEDGDDESTVESETWAALMVTISEDYSDWDADQVAQKCGALAGIAYPSY